MVRIAFSVMTIECGTPTDFQKRTGVARANYKVLSTSTGEDGVTGNVGSTIYLVLLLDTQGRVGLRVKPIRQYANAGAILVQRRGAVIKSIWCSASALSKLSTNSMAI